MKKEIGLIAILVVIIGIGAAVITFWKKPSPAFAPTPPGETIIKVTSYNDASYFYNCSRPIRVKVVKDLGIPLSGGGTGGGYVPVDASEAKLFCHTTAAIENEGKIKVLQRSEVIELISHYTYKDVSIKALEFKYIEDKEYVHRLLPEYQDREIGCIIVLETPNEKRVYLEDEDLETFEELDYQTFAQYLNQVSEADRKLFVGNLR